MNVEEMRMDAPFDFTGCPAILQKIADTRIGFHLVVGLTFALIAMACPFAGIAGAIVGHSDRLRERHTASGT